MSETEREAVLASLAPMFEQADREGLWFFCAYQQTWLSPAELRAKHAEGRMFWGAVNWKLRDPEELRQQAEEAVKKAMAERDRVAARILGARMARRQP